MPPTATAASDNVVMAWFLITCLPKRRVRATRIERSQADCTAGQNVAQHFRVGRSGILQEREWLTGSQGSVSFCCGLNALRTDGSQWHLAPIASRSVEAVLKKPQSLGGMLDEA